MTYVYRFVALYDNFESKKLARTYFKWPVNIGNLQATCVVNLVVVHPLFCSMDLVSKAYFYLRWQMRCKHVQPW